MDNFVLPQKPRRKIDVPGCVSPCALGIAQFFAECSDNCVSSEPAEIDGDKYGIVLTYKNVSGECEWNDLSNNYMTTCQLLVFSEATENVKEIYKEVSDLCDEARELLGANRVQLAIRPGKGVLHGMRQLVESLKDGLLEDEK